MTMDRYTLLGRSGLRVSPISLGTMTFAGQIRRRKRVTRQNRPRDEIQL